VFEVVLVGTFVVVGAAFGGWMLTMIALDDRYAVEGAPEADTAPATSAAAPATAMRPRFARRVLVTAPEAEGDVEVQRLDEYDVA
jgi:hypothetical protein